MTTEIAGSATWRSTVTCQSDGDPDTAAVRNLSAEDLADRTAYLKDKADRSERYADRLNLIAPGLTTGQVSLTIGPGRQVGLHGSGVYGCNASAGYPESFAGISQASAGSSAIYYDVTDLMPKASGTVVSMLYAWIQGQSYSVIPTTLPSVHLLQVDGAGVLSTVASATDSNGTTAAFNAAHSILAGGLTVPVNSGNLYYLKFDFGAGGTGSGIKVRTLVLGVSGSVAP